MHLLSNGQDRDRKPEFTLHISMSTLAGLDLGQICLTLKMSTFNVCTLFSGFISYRTIHIIFMSTAKILYVDLLTVFFIKNNQSVQPS